MVYEVIMKAPTRFIFKRTNLLNFLADVKESDTLFGEFTVSTPQKFVLTVSRKDAAVLAGYLNKITTNVTDVKRRKVVFGLMREEELLPIITAAIETELHELPYDKKNFYRTNALKAVQKAIPLHSELYKEIQNIITPPEPDIDVNSEEFKQEVQDIITEYKQRQLKKKETPGTSKGLLE